MEKEKGRSAQEIIARDMEELYLGNLGTVEFDLELPKQGKHGSHISWHSGNTNFLDHSGRVSRPSYGRGNREVELCARFSYGGCEKEKTYLVTVLEENNRIQVSEICPIERQGRPKEPLCLPGAVAVRTKDGRMIAHFVEWDRGQVQTFDSPGEYRVRGKLKDTAILAECAVRIEEGYREPKEEVHIPVESCADRTRGALPSPVKLLPGSDFYDAQERVHTWLLRTDPDQWLYNFRKAAGLPTGDCAPMTGWDSPEGLLRGHSTGHYLSSLALCFHATGDEEIRRRASYMVSALKECQEAFSGKEGYHRGFLSAYSEEQFDLLEQYTPYPKIWAPYYTLHKILAGLLDLYRLAGMEEAGQIAQGIGDWVYGRLSALPREQRARMWSIYIAGEYGGMNESMAELYRIFGKETYLEAARFFDNDRLFFPLEQGADALDGMHANQHIPQMVGAVKMYEQTGETRYRSIAERFWRIVTGSHTYAIGGTGESEMFHEAGNIAGLLTKATSESCATYNMLKLTKELYRLCPDPSYMEYYERAVLNHILSTCDHAPTGGSTYFLSMRPRAAKSFDLLENSCCHGTGLESHFKYGEAVYFSAGEDILVNLFIPSVLDLGEQKRIELFTDEKEPGRIRLFAQGRGRWKLKVRRPGWALGEAQIKVNGQACPARPEGGYYVIERRWEEPAEIEIAFSCGLRYERTPDDADCRALCFGPYVLAALTGQEEALCLHMTEAEQDFVRKPDRPLAFRSRETGCVFIPLEKVWKEEYQVYIRNRRE